MDCRQASDALSEYIDGRLCVEDAAAVAAHLEGCHACRRLESELRGAVGLLGGLETKLPPADFAEGVAARLERRMLLETPAEAPRRRTIPWPAAGLGLAAAAALILAVYARYVPEGPSPAEAPAAAVAAGEKKGQWQAEAETASRAPRAEAPAVIGLELDKDSDGSAVAKGMAEAESAVKESLAYYALAQRREQAAEGYADAVAGAAHATAPAETASSPKDQLQYGQTAPPTGGIAHGGESVSVAKAEQAVTETAGPDLDLAGKRVQKVKEVSQKPAAATSEEIELTSRLEAANGATGRAGEPLVLTVATEGDALVMAMKLLSLLPGDDGKTARTDAGADAVRAEALARNAQAVEVSADKVVIDVSLDAATARAICARLTPSPGLGVREQAQAAAAQPAATAATAEPGSAPSSRAVSEARDGQAHANAAAPAGGPARVRFVLERAAADAAAGAK